MKHKIILLFFICVAAIASGQTNNGKDLVFRVKTVKTTVKIIPDLLWIEEGSSKKISIWLLPSGREIGKVTFKGGTLTGQGNNYVITAGNGTEGILSVYEKTKKGDKLIINKIYPFKKVIVKKTKGKAQWHVVSPHYK